MCPLVELHVSATTTVQGMAATPVTGNAVAVAKDASSGVRNGYSSLVFEGHIF